MIRVTNSITIKFDTTTKGLTDAYVKNVQENKNILAKLSELISNNFKMQTDTLNNHANAINTLAKLLKQGNKKVEQIIYLYAELSNCGVMDSKKKENLKMQIANLINS